MTRLRSWLHRKGIARTINATGNNWTRDATTWIETRGPRWLGERLWRFALPWSTSMGPDWSTVGVARVEKLRRWHWKWLISYQRATK